MNRHRPLTDSLRDRLQRTLGSAYTIERQLGGGPARAFVARDESLGRAVVIKVLSSELSATLSAERFTHEVKLAASLQEPHIVPILTAGQTDDGLPWYMMPFVVGESLRARIGRGPMPAAEALGILRNIAQALAYAHGRGVEHRDIRPEHVLLPSGTAVVTDFGVATAVVVAADGTPGESGSPVGTPAYMAPEQAQGDANTDHRADIYAWGVMAYELLAGAHPFAPHATPPALDAAHFAEMPAPLADRAWGVPDAVSELVMRSLEKSPDARPQTMAAVLDELAEGQRVSMPMTTAEMRAAEAAEAIAKRPKTPPKRPRAPKPIPSATATAGAPSRTPVIITVAVVAIVLAIVAWMRLRSA